MRKHQNGYTLIEVLAGFALFMAILLPSMLLVMKLVSDPVSKDKLLALEILKGEFSAIKRTHKLPPSREVLHMNGTRYEVACDTTQDQDLVHWTLSVQRKGKPLARIQGLLYESNPTRGTVEKHLE